MRYVIVKPKTREVYANNFDTIQDAMVDAGLEPHAVDMGVLARGLGYVVYEYGLFDPPSQTSYCGIAGRLIPGPTVLYGFDEAGETIDLRRSEIPDVAFYLGVNDVEAAIDRNEIERPEISVNGAVLWQWPQPRIM